MEMNFGKWEGLSWDEVYNRYPSEMDAWGMDWVNVAPPGGESAIGLEKRVGEWLGSLPIGQHLVFTHAGVIRSLRVLLNSWTWADAMKAAVPHLSLEVFHKA